MNDERRKKKETLYSSYLINRRWKTEELMILKGFLCMGKKMGERKRRGGKKC